MEMTQLREHLPPYAKDIRLNLGTLLGNLEASKGAQGTPLKGNQIAGIALSAAYATRVPDVIRAFLSQTRQYLGEVEQSAVKSAVAVMAMNNVYYRSVHLLSDDFYRHQPAGLRMNVIANPGIPKQDFELYALAVSAVNGCGMCLGAHARELEASGLGKEEVLQCLRIAAIVQSVAQVVVMELASA